MVVDLAFVIAIVPLSVEAITLQVRILVVSDDVNLLQLFTGSWLIADLIRIAQLCSLPGKADFSPGLRYCNRS